MHAVTVHAWWSTTLFELITHVFPAGEKALPEEEAEDLHALMAALRWGPALMYGVSSGARVSLLVAHKHPQVCLLHGVERKSELEPISCSNFGPSAT